MKKEVLIIGAGIAGLNAGIELLQNGYDVSIYEKNDEVGGLCSGYFVDGYYIDACLHWLMGTMADSQINELWRNIDAINDDTKFSHLESFCTFKYNNHVVHFGRDTELERKRWLEMSPEDEKPINQFFNAVNELAEFWKFVQIINREDITIDLLKELPSAPHILKSTFQTRKEYAKRFSHPALRFALENAMTGYNTMFFFLEVYGLFVAGDGDVPLGGAYHMMQRVKNKFLSLGGKLYLNTPVEEIITEDKNVTMLKLDGQYVAGDYFISTVDPLFTLDKLLKGKYKNLLYKYLYKNVDKRPISSCFNVYIKIKGNYQNIEVPTCIHTKKAIKVGATKTKAILIRPYYFDKEHFVKDNATVVSLFVDQNQDDYLFYKNNKDYIKEEDRIIKDLMDAFLETYPEFKDKVTYLTHFGPIELEKQTNTSFGSIQSYSLGKNGPFYMFRGKIKSLDNLYFAGQWSRSIGGTPTALLTSHDIVAKLIKYDRKIDKKISAD